MKKIGRYIIQGLLGRGGMGKVFKVKLPIINKIAALKILIPILWWQNLWAWKSYAPFSSKRL